MLSIPEAMFFGNGPQVVSRMKMQRVDKIAVRRGKIRLEPNRLAIGSNRFVQLPRVLQYAAKIAMRRGVVGLEHDGLTICSDCLVEFPRFSKGSPETVVS